MMPARSHSDRNAGASTRESSLACAAGLALALVLTLAGPWISRAEAVDSWKYDQTMMKPFWRSKTMYGESVLPVRPADGHELSLPLLFTPEKIIAVSSSSGDKIYKAGRDYAFTAGVAALTIPKGSAIPLIDPARLTVKPGTQQFALTRRDGSGEVMYGGKLEWQDMQVVVTYTHAADAWKGSTPAFAGAQLPRTMARLQARKPLHVVLLGDSISVGCNASKLIGLPPFQPAYGELFIESLRQAYGTDIAFENRSVSGQTASWGASVVKDMVLAKPDLMIIAFGMNDAAGGASGPAFSAATKAQIDGVRAALPETEFILVASFPGNGEWTLMDVTRFPVYRDELAKLCGPGIALADVTSLWNDMLKVKSHRDVTGNGVNHPNDFGHRLYAQVLSALLIK